MFILYILIVVAVIFTVIFIKSALEQIKHEKDVSNITITLSIGLVTDFFDTLGIGAFAPTTALLKFTKQIDEGLLPGTLNVSHTIPVVVEACIFITVVEVETVTLVSLILASVAGAYLGAGVISKMGKKPVKILMGFALFAVGIIMVVNEIGIIDGLGVGNTATGLEGIKLIIGIVVFTILGALMSAGVGLYAPAMATVFILGMSPIVAFPIMMGACAFLMPIGSIKFIKEKAYAAKVSVAITIGGVIGVIIAAPHVAKLDLAILIDVVIVIIFITSLTMLYEVFIKPKKKIL